MTDFGGNYGVSIDSIHIEFAQILLKCVENIRLVIDNIILYDVNQFETTSKSFNNLLIK